jgi:hypothetical protein
MTPEKLFEAHEAAMKRFDDGEPLVAVDPEEFERAWMVVHQLRDAFPSSKATGLGAIASTASLDYESKSADEVMGFWMRGTILAALIKRGVIDGYLDNGEPRRAVFRAAASISAGKEDLAEAMLLANLAEAKPEVVEQFKKEAHENGYDPDHPRIDAKFLDWLKQAG